VNRIARLNSRWLPDPALDPVSILLASQRLAEATAVAVVRNARVEAEHERGLASERVGEIGLDRGPAGLFR
jgi:hypothetical protein